MSTPPPLGGANICQHRQHCSYQHQCWGCSLAVSNSPAVDISRHHQRSPSPDAALPIDQGCGGVFEASPPRASKAQKLQQKPEKAEELMVGNILLKLSSPNEE